MTERGTALHKMHLVTRIAKLARDVEDNGKGRREVASVFSTWTYACSQKERLGFKVIHEATTFVTAQSVA